MHDTAMTNARIFFDAYVRERVRDVSVVDIGAQDFNGSIRDIFVGSQSFIGVDFAAGKGVDVVLTDPYAFALEDASADVVVSSSCFEHSQMFWLTFCEVMRILRPGGLFYLNAPSNGVFHRFPVDCWRFYPDAGGALVAWARRQGFSVALLESFISRQQAHCFNDFVAVFLKDEAYVERYPNRMLSSIRFVENGTSYGHEGLINRTMFPEDWKRSDHFKRILHSDQPPSVMAELEAVAKRELRSWMESSR